MSNKPDSTWMYAKRQFNKYKPGKFSSPYRNIWYHLSPLHSRRPEISKNTEKKNNVKMSNTAIAAADTKVTYCMNGFFVIDPIITENHSVYYLFEKTEANIGLEL